MSQSRSPELSDIFARLSDQAKKVEGAFADLAAKTDANAAKRDEHVQAGWRSMQADIDKQIKGLQAAKAAREHERDVQRAEHNAQEAQARADWTASYAAAASEMARLAAVDAEAAQSEANALKQR
jgi:hypothetical protein